MSAFADFEKEKLAIDQFLDSGYVVVAIQENLEGALVKFSKDRSSTKHDDLHLITADARKYLTTRLLMNGQLARSV
ncbi:hypothetical protein QCD85_14325 [Paenibacillus sp. PsM32]|uniref:hypothetical protein n=1 Tax=unclassified Paenibacillus TaxID=185978 RepID=UPI002366B1E7|nr:MULTISPECIES: hypothetical protein [unclassified Paenibacillus]MDN4619281.1 hypothetical protein [Paenibacillus sp. PsM32]MDQ1237178.1 hypothetical protein [Paenibacillus sp. SORGH_AS_0306]MDR6109537.1 hypothetical protein [Paenibacillus sp. SORGH_AS_0338]WDF50348.1 hypothetical protein PQ460_20620 [Paenibacillus sp. KACC 21273]